MFHNLHIFGLGFTASAVAKLLPPASVTTRFTPPSETEAALRSATHLLLSAPPDHAGDPCLARFADAVAGAKALRWIGYCSSVGVYGGGVVDEATAPAPKQPRGVRRLAAEEAWRAIRPDLPLDLFRLAGIYGPGRSVFDDLRAGTARSVVAPAHRFNRIHRDAAARAIVAAMSRPVGVRVLHLADDLPAASSEVVGYAAALLGMAPPPAIGLDEALAGMSPTARSFWAESRLIENAATKQALGIEWLYPSYREGLEAILAEEAEH